MKRIVVAGSRGFTDYTLLRENLDALLGETSGDVELISGHAAGADQLAERYAQERNIPITVMRPDWKTYGRAAGPVRNKQMLDYASEGSPLVIAFWDGKSKGTKNTIDTAQKMGISIKVVLYYPGIKSLTFTHWIKHNFPRSFQQPKMTIINVYF